MWYVFLAEYEENSLEKRAAVREQHLQRLDELYKKGRVLAAGPMPNIDSQTPGDAGFSGSVIIAEFDSIADAKLWAETEPYLLAGVYKDNIVIKPFVAVYPK